ncbi:MAG: hypothetical protein KF799_07400 [Bdellovibrionales bacterium]|nr:hypothetical protein [Bdellovibrionales bacterium]
MAKPQRILVLVHPQFDPRKGGRTRSATEYDVWKALCRLGHAVEIAPAESDLKAFDRQLARSNPSLVFNLLEEFRGCGVFDFHLVTYLEALGVPYTGCNPRGLIVTRNKLWTAHIARGEGLSAPASRLVHGKRSSFAAETGFPLLVKYNREHASMGMTQANVVRTRAQLTRSLVRLQERFDGDVLMQEFIPGKEISVGLWGNSKPEALAPWRLNLPSVNDIATERVKFNARYRFKKGIRATRWIDASAEKNLKEEARRLFMLFDMNGYARLDFRINAEGKPFLIDVNANPCLAKTEDFATAALAGGVDYAQVIQKIVQLGLNYRPRQ